MKVARCIAPAVAIVELLALLAACGGSVETGSAPSADSGLGAKRGAGGFTDSGGPVGSGGTGGGGIITFGGAQGVCDLQPAPGPCDAAITRYFNEPGFGCQAFTYGGCQGNENNFETLEGCRNYCAHRLTCHCGAGSATCTANRECLGCQSELGRLEGMGCTMTGLSCSHDGSTCSCVLGDAGTAIWRCRIRV